MQLLDINKYKKYWDDNEVNDLRLLIQSSFNELEFVEESHQYFLKKVEMECVSNVTHRFQEGFDKIPKSEETSERHFNNPMSEYYQMTPEQIVEKWDLNSRLACERGSKYHEFGESCFHVMTGHPELILPSCLDRYIGGNLAPKFYEEEQIIEFWNDLPDTYIPILCENRVYSEKYKYAGTFDKLFAYKDNKGTPLKLNTIITDYKTNKNLYKNFKGKILLPPFQDDYDMPVNVYKIQLGCYQIPLEDIGIKVIGRRLIWVKEHEPYVKIPLDDITPMLREALINVN